MAALSFLAAHWKTVAAFAVALFLAAALHEVVSLKTANEALQSQAAELSAKAQRLSADLARNRKALEDREAENRALAERHEADMAALRGAFASDPESCAWSGEKIPDSVLEALGCAR
ncbi:MAG: hypothetical protein LBW85_08460 [Deltaproteobacteria bacterium]|jgi:predicted  nucleic acid-binding Zn-ribbon protein|nr:hypothetical protein [Deltaproteobacteria bacterium]